MNTLKYKALSIKLPLIIFIKALGIYLLLTLPALAIPLIYMQSAIFVCSFGWIAAAVFIILFCIIQHLPLSVPIRHGLVHVSVSIAVLVAFQMIEVLGAWEAIWQSGYFLLFPAAAAVAGWISVSVSGNKIRLLFEDPFPANHLSSLSAHQNNI